MKHGEAKEVNELALKGKGPLMKVAGRFKSLLAKAAKRVGRLVPIVGGILVIIDFTENAEAHGVGGALIRSAPMLGDLVTVYDVASDVAAQVEAQAAEDIAQGLEDANRSVQDAHESAATLTVQEFRRISKKVRVTNPYFDPESLKEPIRNYYETVLILYHLRSQEQHIRYPAGATVAEKAAESAFRMKMRMAREELEREIREQVEKPAEPAPRGPIG